MERYNWSDIKEEQLNARLTRRVIHTTRKTIARMTGLKGVVVPLHQHANEQVTMMESGVMRFEMAGEEFILRAGDILVIPPDVPHRVEALEDCVAMDVFTPARGDWIKGDDAYLKEPAIR